MMPVIQAGFLNRRIEIHNPQEATDNYGTITLTYTRDKLNGYQWASIRPVGAAESLAGDELQATTLTDITMRHNTVLTARSRIIYGERTWEVLGIRNVEDADVYLVATCREIAP